MNPVLTNSIVVAGLSGLLSGVAVALLTYFLSRKRTDAEIGNLKAQADKAMAETDKIRAELKNVSATVSFNLPSGAEQILVDGKSGLDGFDVKGSEGQFWVGSGKDAKPTSPMAEGKLKFEEGALNVQRDNTEGRFELRFIRYIYKGKEYALIPKDDLISGKRRLLASCEAKVVGGEHSLRFVIRDPTAGQKLAEEVVRVATTSWATYQVFLSADAGVESQFRIDDEQVSRVPSSIQIRNVVLAQRN
jgi:hypothetical protein